MLQVSRQDECMLEIPLFSHFEESYGSIQMECTSEKYLQTFENCSCFSCSCTSNQFSSLPFLPPTTKLAQGYVFTYVCDSVHRGSASVHACWDTDPLPRRPPLGTRHPQSTACWHIRTTTGQQASYLNAILYLLGLPQLCQRDFFTSVCLCIPPKHTTLDPCYRLDSFGKFLLLMNISLG